MAPKNSSRPRRGEQPKRPTGKKAAKSAEPYKRPNTELERLKAIHRAKGYINWLNSLSPAERRYERRRLQSERSKALPSPAALDDDLTRLLIAVGVEFVKRYYPDAAHASFTVWHPRGKAKPNYGHVSIDIDSDRDVPVIPPPGAPKPSPVPGGLPIPAEPTPDEETAAGRELADAVRRYGERMKLPYWLNATVSFRPARADVYPAPTLLVPFEDDRPPQLGEVAERRPPASSSDLAATLRDWLQTARGALSLMREEAASMKAERAKGGPLAD